MQQASSSKTLFGILTDCLLAYRQQFSGCQRKKIHKTKGFFTDSKRIFDVSPICKIVSAKGKNSPG